MGFYISLRNPFHFLSLYTMFWCFPVFIFYKITKKEKQVCITQLRYAYFFLSAFVPTALKMLKAIYILLLYVKPIFRLSDVDFTSRKRTINFQQHRDLLQQNWMSMRWPNTRWASSTRVPHNTIMKKPDWSLHTEGSWECDRRLLNFWKTGIGERLYYLKPKKKQCYNLQFGNK